MFKGLMGLPGTSSASKAAVSAALTALESTYSSRFPFSSHPTRTTFTASLEKTVSAAARRHRLNHASVFMVANHLLSFKPPTSMSGNPRIGGPRKTCIFSSTKGQTNNHGPKNAIHPAIRSSLLQRSPFTQVRSKARSSLLIFALIYDPPLVLRLASKSRIRHFNAILAPQTPRVSSL